ncbi:MAG: hypothetical protein AAF481_06860, partial [Acidobacteriota bacterium]
FQVGAGANNKNVAFGASGWFDWNVTSQPTAGPKLEVTGQGDFNVDLGFDCEPVCAGDGKVKDSFKQRSYSNNDGPDSWDGPWIEDDVAGAGPNSGNVWIDNGFLFLNDQPDTGTEPSIARQVNLDGAQSATLRFAFDTGHGVDPSDAVTVEVSNDGGATWTVLEVITGISGAVEESRTFDISGHISANTQVRFRVTNLYGGSNEFFCLRFVEITYSCDPPVQHPCPGCDHYNGSLKNSGDYDLHPDGTYYYANAGTHRGVLEGPAGSDFELELYRWNGNGWSRVDGSWESGSSEEINYNGSSGYYIWMIESYSGGGSYDFWLDSP